MTDPTVSVFIRSYRGDREWLTYCLRSIKKFLREHHELVVCLPVGDEPHFDLYDFHGARVVWHKDVAGDGYLSQQEAKLHADTYCTGSHIMFLDSDCFLTEITSVLDFFSGQFGSWGDFVAEKPIMLLRHWSEVGEAIMWQPVVTKALGEPSAFECMAAQPLIYDRQSFPLLRQHMESLHNMSVTDYISRVKGRDFSEFNVLGAFCLRYTPHLYDFRIANPATDGFPRTIRQQWSWQQGGVERHRAEYEEILAR